MVIETRDFGRIELDEDALLEFRSPIFGFDDLKHYVLLSDDEAGPGLLWLQSIEQPGVCFILLDPVELGLDYQPEVPADIRETLQLEDGAAVVKVIAVVPDDFRNTTVNLKSPLFINPGNKWAAQAILEDEYPLRMQLFAQEGSQC